MAKKISNLNEAREPGDYIVEGELAEQMREAALPEELKAELSTEAQKQQAAVEELQRIDFVATKLKELFEGDENMSIKQLAGALGVNYTVLIKASKAPIVGKMYDPEAVNYTAMAQVIIRKLGDKVNEVSWENIRDVELDEEVVELSVKVGDHAFLRDVQNADGSVTKFPEYVVHIVTPTHIVIMAENETKPRVMSKSTFKHSGGTILTMKVEENGADA